MVSPSTSTASSVSSISSISFSDDPPRSPSLKFLCSYSGRILPRVPDGRLRYVGGVTRVLAVPRSISFSDLMDRMSDLCAWGGRISLRCQIPTEDLDALVSITSDEDLENLIEEYELADRDRASSRKIRAFLFAPSLPPSASSSPQKGKDYNGVDFRLRGSPPRYPHYNRHRHVCAVPASAHAHVPRMHLIPSSGHWQ